MPRFKKLSGPGRGLLVIAIILGCYMISFQKSNIRGLVEGGTTIQANFTDRPVVDKGVTEVKVADSIVGTVRDARQLDNGQFQLDLKIDDETAAVLGREPKAQLRATSVLGGKLFVDLQPSGDGGTPGDTPIPASRTKGVVQLGDVLTAFQPDARDGLKTAVGQLDEALEGESQPALRRLLTSLPPASRPTELTFRAALGTRPDQDLPDVVVGAHALAAELSAREGRIANIVDDVDVTTASIASESSDLEEMIGDLPDTLSSTREGLDSVRKTLDKLEDTARSARPTVREAEPLVDELDSTLDDLQPMVHDLNPLLTEAAPVLEDSVPLAKDLHVSLKNLDSPVIDRISGPITDAVVKPWSGTGGFEGNGNDNPLYKELGYLATRGNLQSIYGSHNGTHLALELGVGFSTLGGNDLGFSAIFQQLFGIVPIPDALKEQIKLPSGVKAPATSATSAPSKQGTADASGEEPDSGNPIGDVVDTTTEENGGLVNQIKNLLGSLGGRS